MAVSLRVRCALALAPLFAGCQGPTNRFDSPAAGQDPAARSGSAAVVQGEAIWLLGGTSNRDQGWTPRPARWEPESGLWSLGCPDEPRAFACAAVQGGRVLVAGGANAEHEALARARWYDPSGDQWIAAPDLGHSRSQAGAFADRGRVFVVGGWTAEGNTASVEYLEPGASSWRPAAPMPTARHGFALVEHAGQVAVLGGYVTDGEDQVPCAVVELYDPERDHWTIGVPLPEPRAFHGALGHRSGLLVFGGRMPLTAPTPKTLHSRGLYSGWEATDATLPLARNRYAVCRIGDTAYLFGGEGIGEGDCNVQRLDLVRMDWETLP